MDIAFVVLHYNVLEETVSCIKSIKDNIDTKSFKIVIVDNGSPNKSGIKLQEIFKKDGCVDVVLVEENIGFARGNNIGIKYSRDILHADYVCCLNNDTILEQKDFFKILVNEYDNTGAALIGPQVIISDNSIQRFSSKIMDVDVYKKQLLALTKGSYIEYIKMKIKSAFLFRKLNSIRRKMIGIEENPFVDQNDVLLHGCCLIFSPIFFQYLSGFDDRTFLYREEELLFLSVKRYNLKTQYTPKLKIKHLEDVSTNSISKNRKKKEELKRKYLIDSTRILIATLEKTREV